MGNLSEHFSTQEFACHCNYKDCPGHPLPETLKPLAEALEKYREVLGVPIIIRCGYRCAKHNKDVGGSPRSQHMEGRAVDLHASDHPGWTPESMFFEALTISEFHGIGLYDWGIHVDVRPGKRVTW